MPTTKDLFTELRRRFEPFISQALAHADAQPARQAVPAPAPAPASATGPNAGLQAPPLGAPAAEPAAPPAPAASPAPADPLAACAKEMDRLADRESRLAPPQGLGARELAAARLAAFTFADELLLARPGSTWFAHGLQLNRLRATDGGSRFFDTLGELLDAAAQEKASSQGQAAILLDMVTHPGTGTGPSPRAHLARGMSNLARDLDPSACNPPLAAAAFMALCLVYGFRGELYQAERHTELAELIQASRLLLARINESDEGHEALLGNAQILPSGRKFAFLARLKRPNAFVLVLAPIILTALWYVLCATLVNTMTLPWSGA